MISGISLFPWFEFYDFHCMRFIQCIDDPDPTQNIMDQLLNNVSFSIMGFIWISFVQIDKLTKFIGYQKYMHSLILHLCHV